MEFFFKKTIKKLKFSNEKVYKLSLGYVNNFADINLIDRELEIKESKILLLLLQREMFSLKMKKYFVFS